MDLTAGLWLGPHSLHLVLAGPQGDHSTFWVPSHPRIETAAALSLLLDAATELAREDAIASIAVALPASTGHAERVTALRTLTAASGVETYLVATPLSAALSIFKGGDVLTLEIERGAVSMGWVKSQERGFELAGLMSWRDPEWRAEVQEGHPVYASYLTEAPLITPALLNEMATTFTDGDLDALPSKILALGPLAWDGPLLAAFQRNIDLPSFGVGPDELARGAARYARIRRGLEPEVRCTSILDSVVGIDSSDPETFAEVLDWFDPLPSMRSLSVTTATDEQRDIAITVYQGANDTLEQASLVGIYEIGNISPGPAGSVSIEVMLDVDENGLIGVSAFDLHTQEDLEIAIVSEPWTPRYCVECGFSSASEAKFCEGCGQDLNQCAPVEVIDRQLTAVMALERTESEAHTPTLVSPGRNVTCLPCGSIAHTDAGQCHSCGFPTDCFVTPLSDLEFAGLRVSYATIIDSLGVAKGPVGPLRPTVLVESHPVVVGEKECPFCAEIIKVAARKCRHCGEFLEGAQSHQVEVIGQDSGAFLFISHASQDHEVALDVASALDEAGLSTWLATRDIKVGENYASQIYDAIAECTHLLVLLSPTSVQSQHVKREANIAIDLGKPLLPLVVAHDADFMRALPSEWKYWLGVVQAAPYTDATAAVITVQQSIGN